jgi:hypothetical protein
MLLLAYVTPIPVAPLSKASVCGHSLAGIAGLNPSGSIDVCLSVCCVLCVGRLRSLRRADYSSRGVLPCVCVCVCVCDQLQK